MPATADANALGRYLRVRRALARPDAAEVPGQGNRRVPGLRREEVAFLAGVSSDYMAGPADGSARGWGSPVSPARAVATSVRVARTYVVAPVS